MKMVGKSAKQTVNNRIYKSEFCQINNKTENCMVHNDKKSKAIEILKQLFLERG